MAPRRFRLMTTPRLLLCCAALALVGARVAGQSSSARMVIAEIGLPGIDRGLREHEPIRPPRLASGQATLVDRHAAERGGSTPAATYEPGSVIVKFRDAANTQAVTSALRAIDGLRVQRPSYADFVIVDIPADVDPEAAAADLSARPDVEYAQPRYLNHAMLRPNDPFYDRQWHLAVLNMERAWEIQPEAGSKIVVAVLDGGVAFRTQSVRYFSQRPFRLDPGGPVFPALGVVDVPFAAAPELGENRFVAPYDFIWDDALPYDLDGHGTHVAGTIGQLTNNGEGVAGMAFNVRIMPVKVLASEWDVVFGAPNQPTDDIVARGIRYAADHGAHVINMSFGRTEGGPATVVEQAIRYAVSRGAFVVVSGGNTAETGNQPSRTAAAAPAIEGMVAVGAVGRDLTRAFYSTRASYIELAAPGGDQRRGGATAGVLQQTIDLDLLLTFERGPGAIVPPRADAFAYYYFQGTSMAAPHVSGLAALLRQQGITNPAAIEAAMKRFARDLGPAGVDDEYGHGLIQPRETLRGLGLAR
jgi:serine protease